MAIGDIDGNTLAIIDVTGSRWAATDDGFTNLNEFRAEIIREGIQIRAAMTDAAGNMLAAQGMLSEYCRIRVRPRDTTIFTPGSIILSYSVLAPAQKRVDEDRLMIGHPVRRLTFKQRLLGFRWQRLLG